METDSSKLGKKKSVKKDSKTKTVTDPIATASTSEPLTRQLSSSSASLKSLETETRPPQDTMVEMTCESEY